jgi:hypothetical protein
VSGVVFRTKIAWIPRLSLLCGALASFIIWFFIPLTLPYVVFSSPRAAGWPLGSSSVRSVFLTFE